MSESLLVGETIIFTTDGFVEQKGLVMGVISMKVKATDIYPTTGYVVLVDEDGSLKNVPYWQVASIVQPDQAYIDLMKKEGGKIPVYFPKYEKKPHPKGFAVDHESNDDLPM